MEAKTIEDLLIPYLKPEMSAFQCVKQLIAKLEESEETIQVLREGIIMLQEAESFASECPNNWRDLYKELEACREAAEKGTFRPKAKAKTKSSCGGCKATKKAMNKAMQDLEKEVQEELSKKTRNLLDD